MNIPLEQNIPLPPRAKARNSGRDAKYPFSYMRVGDSFAVKKEGAKTASRLNTCARAFAKRNGNGHKFAVRTLGEQVRVWRTA